MSTENGYRRAIVTIIACAVAMAALSGRVLATPGDAGSTTAASTPADPDGGWPRSMATASGATIVMYPPQVLSWKNQTQLTLMAALSYQPQGSQANELGTVTLESPTSVSMPDRLVNLAQIQIADIHFASLGKTDTQDAVTEIQRSLPAANLVVSLDRVLAAVDKSEIRGDGIQVKTDPPPIFYSTRPAILVQFDGPPIMSPIDATSLKYVVNTNWDVFQDTTTQLWLLRDTTYWLKASATAGPWAPAGKLPGDFEKLPDDGNWTEVQANVPGKKVGKDKAPTVFVSEKPAELILLNGDPKFVPVTGTHLLWIQNTDSDFFRMKDADYYFLVSGRWFRAPGTSGPWTFATTNLPDDFRHIPPDHPRARVLASVPGTEEAAEAILLANVPQTARVDAKAIQAPDVEYDGDPKFTMIEGTAVAYATNTSFDVLLVSNSYYLCYQAVWFGASSPKGPWAVATVVPKAIYAIPASAPVYNVTYVTVVDPNPAYPTYAYTAGYTGVTVAYGCVMFGTGWYYPPYVYYPPYGYPVYHPWPPSYGCGAVYNPWTGAYGGYHAAYGPYGGVAAGATYNPNTGTYKRGAMAYGPYGAQGVAQAYNPRTGTYGATHQGSNAYGSWGSSHVQQGDNWAQTQRVTDANGNTHWAAQGSGGGSATGWKTAGGSSAAVGQKDGDVYAGKDGNVYKKTDDGWQQYQHGSGWSGASGDHTGGTAASGQRTGGGQPSTMDGLNRDAESRNTGNQRAQQFGGYRQGGGGGRRR